MMNMDEFPTNVWTTQKNQALINGTQTITTINDISQFHSSSNDISAENGKPKQPSLHMCKNTVDEIWYEMQKDNNLQNSDSAPRKELPGEMTLEDFLTNAAVVLQPSTVGVLSCTQPRQQQQYGTYQNNEPIMSGGDFSGLYEPLPVAVSLGGRGSAQSMVMEAPVISCVSLDGMCSGRLEKSGQFGSFEMGGARGSWKTSMDGAVEKVVERRRRRMIKNRESAARSRARKQAYTVELEAELNHLREENEHIKQDLEELERRREQQYYEENREGETKAEKAKRKLRALMRNLSCPL